MSTQPKRPTAADLGAMPTMEALRQAAATELQEAAHLEGQPQLAYGQLIDEMLLALIAGDDDRLMELRAETICRFRRSDAQIEAALFRRHTQVECGISKRPERQSLDISAITGMDWLVPGFIPANDLTLLYGEAGTGKTSAALLASRAVLDGVGMLDHEAPAQRGKVLFIASDSGAAPLVAAMQEMGMTDMPEAKEGPHKRFHIWAADQQQGQTSWAADLRSCIELLAFVKEDKIDLVVKDSCKAICSAADLDYTNNTVVTALLTYLKVVLTPHCAVLLLSHDGTARNAAAGAKAWREIPSAVHQLQIEEKDGKPVSDTRLWRMTKSRMGPGREFRYGLRDGEPVLAVGIERVGSCHDRLLEVLKDAWFKGEKSLRRDELIGRTSHGGGAPSSRTIDNTLQTAARAKHPDICRATRGRYKLAPRIIDSLKSVHAEQGVIPKKQDNDRDLSITRQLPEGNYLGNTGESEERATELPGQSIGELVGESGNASADKGSQQLPPGLPPPLKGTDLSGRPASTTTTERVRLALRELRLAPHPAMVPRVMAWLAQSPEQPSCSHSAVTAAMVRLQEEDQDEDTAAPWAA